MAGNERIKKYLEAGTVFGQVTRGRAEEIVRELANSGDIQKDQAQEWVDNLVDRSRKTSEQVLELIRHEVTTQLRKIDASSLETIANQVADLLKRSAEAGRSATAAATTQAGKTASDTAKAARTAATKVSPSGRKKATKKATARTSAAKKTATKTATKKAAAKKAPANKAGATKKAATKKAGPGGSSS